MIAQSGGTSPGGGEGGGGNASVTGTVDKSGTNVTTTAQGGPFGNSVEPGGAYAIVTTGTGKGTPKKITTQLFKKDDQQQWVSQGAATTVPLPNPIPQSGSWSNVRYKNLAAGTYKIEIIFEYDADNPQPATPNPQKATATWSGTFS